MNIAIILASGVGKRMKAGKNKTLLELDNKPLIYYAIKNFEKSKLISKIVLVVREGEEKYFNDIVKKYNFKKIIAVISGGEERQYSAHNGIKFIEDKFGKFKKMIVLFHNGANPFVSQNEIKNVVTEALKYGAAAVAHKTKDTIRRVNDANLSSGVIEREGLWNMQTPQAIEFSLAKRVFKKAQEDNFLGTDDVSLVERLGKKVKIIEASENNFKITTPLDLELARIVLRR
ncbi:MAG: 2-C-methyl-D-erythritol 4-phosphate cytidylyltransferase [Candidatus Moranbacteria bacterium]|jgi:2-C-methyl-D-erythritol 4-phosphate cytidylyltransferase|nr:2-C-methyl-D-erythritol 4-phosphate cytidylyltransferase [Candidatus Moranbacteria bacterium]